MGAWLAAVLSRFPSLEGTLYDRSAVVALARQRLNGDPLEHRIRFAEGDFLQDNLPGEHDAVLIANVLHLFPTEKNCELLARVRSCAPDRARLLLADLWMNSTQTEPLLAALMAGGFLLTRFGGECYSEDDVGAWLHKTGWRLLERRPLAGPHSLIVAEAS
jgi:hypothetical protein